MNVDRHRDGLASEFTQLVSGTVGAPTQLSQRRSQFHLGTVLLPGISIEMTMLFIAQ